MEELLNKFFNANDVIPGFLVLAVLSYLGFGFYNLKKHNDWNNDNMIMILVTCAAIFVVVVFIFFVLAQYAGMAFNFMKSLYLK